LCDTLGRHLAQAHDRHALRLDPKQRGRQVDHQVAPVGGPQLGALLERLPIQQPAPQNAPAAREIAVPRVADQFGQVTADQRLALRPGEQGEGFIGRQNLGRRVQADGRPRQQLERFAFQRRFDCRLPQGDDRRTQAACIPRRYVGFIFAFKRYRARILPRTSAAVSK